ncbi:MAG TPA: response regulator [Rhodanobacteraceae bacterium]
MNALASKPDETLRVLLVEDVPADAELTLDALRDDGIACQARCVETEADYVEALEAFAPDIVLSDMGLPVFDGYQALRLLRQRDALTPFIFVSGAMGEEVAVQALHQGATDYILKDNTVRLTAAVRRAVNEAREQRARLRAEEELIRAQRFESLALLAGGLSHDLRNLLQPLLLAADTLDDYADDPRLVRLGEVIRNCGHRGLEMVSSMLTFARGAKRTERVRVDALFDALSLLLKGSVPRTVTLRMERGAEDGLSLDGNHTELQQCLLNLALNAIQAMPDGGQLTFSAHACDLSADFFRASEDAVPGRFVCLDVTDTGQGMAPDVLQHLFQPFFTTKDMGTGLGLVSCRRIVEGHGGVLRVRSAPGQGTCFHLYLPLAVGSTQHVTEQAAGGHGEHVLVVDENATQLSLLAGTLTSAGYVVRACNSGTAALQSLAIDGLPQLLVMDAAMSLVTGVRTLAALLAADYAGSVLFLTDPEAPPSLDELPPLKHFSLLDKPVEVGGLLHAVGHALDMARQNPA